MLDYNKLWATALYRLYVDSLRDDYPELSNDELNGLADVIIGDEMRYILFKTNGDKLVVGELADKPDGRSNYETT